MLLYVSCVAGGIRGLGASVENPNCIFSADIYWLKEDAERGMFTSVQTYRDNNGLFKRRCVMKSDQM